MKKVIILMIIIVTVILLPPYFIGNTAKEQVNDGYKKLSLNPTFNLNVIDYKQGWFSSVAKVKLELDSPNDIGIPSVEFTQEISHGPFLWTSDKFGIGILDSKIELKIPESSVAKISSTQNSDNFGVIYTRIGFSNNSTTIFDVIPFSSTEGGLVINIKEGSFRLDVTDDKNIDLKGSWNGFTLIEEGKEVAGYSEFTVDSKQSLVSGELYTPTAITTGHLDLKIGDAFVNAKNEPPINAKNFYFSVNSAIESNLMKINLKVGLSSLNAIQKAFENFIYDMTLENLDLDAVRGLGELFSDPQVQNNPMLASSKMQELLPKLLEKNIVLKVNNLGLDTPEGQISSKVEIGINQDLYDTNNPMTMMLALNAIANGEGPEEFFTNLGMGGQIEQMVQQNFLIRSAGKIKFDFSFQQGQALLNGNPIPLM